MKREFLMDAIEFEWDPEKEESNIRKHGIDFAAACQVFRDADRLEFCDGEHSEIGETRYITIGYVLDVLTVVYTERGDRLRIISARRATRLERMMYYGD